MLNGLLVLTTLWLLNGVLANGEPYHKFESALQPCPATCTSPDVTQWTVYTSLDRLKVCKQPMLLGFALQNDLADPDTTVKLYACTQNVSQNNTQTTLAGRDESSKFTSSEMSHQIETRQDSSGICPVTGEMTLVHQSELQVVPAAVSNGTGLIGSNALSGLFDVLEKYLNDASHCNKATVFAYHQGVAAAVYTGSFVDPLTSLNALKALKTSSIRSGVIVQLCGSGRNRLNTVGIAIHAGLNALPSAQAAALTWSNGQCAKSSAANSTAKVSARSLKFQVIEAQLNTTGSSSKRNSTMKESKEKRYWQASTLLRRADCSTITVQSGDGCGSLANRCGISANDFTKYNPDPNLCSTLSPGQSVCCSPGTLPDKRPKPNSNGTCATYIVQSEDNCSNIAAKNSLKISDISSFNDGTTWGWFGCGNVPLGLAICLSTGNPPMPAAVKNAVCGPIVPGTQQPTNGTNIASLNPCPLNSCCDIWGQCGITPEYCTNSTGPTGNPGTAPVPQNGCISNCGVDIKPPKLARGDPYRIGYYESWNWDRPCLDMKARDINNFRTYSHVHWGFATIDPNTFDVIINDTYKQFGDFQNGTFRKIISFGGWAFSTDPSTYNVLRQAMAPANQDTFAKKVVLYMNQHGLDGVDFDWEYPGAPDIPGIPPGQKSDGPNYLSFLQTIRGYMPQGKTVSIAAPASYWYLRAFPIAQMAQYLDYIVFETYDLHGQWDYGNTFTQEGCAHGNCLRSHVNLTETAYTLSMITKAGVDASKIAVGVASYGRSFGMVDPSCSGPQCNYVGPNSGAAAGVCTQTPGYIGNAELYQLISTQNLTPKYDQGSDSVTLVYNQSTWVAYMDSNTYTSRLAYYDKLGFAGSAEWAIDLGFFSSIKTDLNSTDDDGDELNMPPLAACTKTWNTIEDLNNDVNNVPWNCVGTAILQTLSTQLTAAFKSYDALLAGGYDSKFNTYANAVYNNAPASLHAYIYAHGNDYFNCLVVEQVSCCSSCTGGCKDLCYTGNTDCTTEVCHGKLSCETGGSVSKRNISSADFDPDFGAVLMKRLNVNKLHGVNASEPCPPDFTKRKDQTEDNESLYWSFQSGKSDQFYADVLTNLGFDKSKIALGTYEREACSGIRGDCQFGHDFSIPVINGYSKSDVTNPKDTVQKAKDNSDNLVQDIRMTVLSMQLQTYSSQDNDAVDAVSLPALMIIQAVESMQTVVDVANQIDEAKRKEIIIAFLSAILFLVPIGGEALGAIGETAIGAVVSAVGAAGNILLDTYNFLSDPSNPALAIVGFILDPLALLSEAKVAQAASARRGMSDADVAKLGGKLPDRLQTIQKLTGKCFK